MKVIFTKSSKLLSRIIREVTGDSYSHVVIEENGFVFHCNLLGPQFEKADKFFNSCRKVVTYEAINDNHKRNFEKLCKYYLRRKHQSYDFLFFLSLGIYLILSKYLALPVPKSLIRRTSGAYLCFEYVTAVLYNSENTVSDLEQLELHLLRTGWKKIE